MTIRCWTPHLKLKALLCRETLTFSQLSFISHPVTRLQPQVAKHLSNQGRNKQAQALQTRVSCMYPWVGNLGLSQEPMSNGSWLNSFTDGQRLQKAPLKGWYLASYCAFERVPQWFCKICICKPGIAGTSGMINTPQYSSRVPLCTSDRDVKIGQ